MANTRATNGSTSANTTLDANLVELVTRLVREANAELMERIEGLSLQQIAAVRAQEGDAVHGNNNVYGALESRLGIPMFYGSDAVHGNNNVYGATVFPHNVGLGATRGCFFDDDINWMRRKTLSIIMN
ncbi:Glycoside hydrolase family 3 [Artemisia annua]|uniref:Glycoside hydrolase family 3 n=1 Tax=Artemisia annua TaxID=35608 RepID=A0A2U1LVK6_ARTAN|nr:Glycoside hydrolase family 3 [Artemisia annua]